MRSQRAFCKGLLAVSLMSALGLSSCGIGLEDSVGPNKDRLRKNELIRKEYRPIEGVYEGSLKIPSSQDPVSVRFYLFLAEEQGGVDSGDLKPGINVVLRGRLLQTQYIGDSDNLILSGQYDSNTGRLLLSPDAEVSKTASGCRLGGQEPISIDASVGNQKVTGAVQRYGQQWGQLDLKLVPGARIEDGAVLDENQDNARIEAFYRPIIGTYKGQLNRNICEAERKEESTLLIYIEKKQIGTNSAQLPCYASTLRGRFYRDVIADLSDVRFLGNNRYDADSGELELQIEDGSIRLSGQISGGDDARLEAQIDTTGDWGQLEGFKKVSNRVLAPNNEAEFLRSRLINTYRPFLGVYKGKVQPYQPGKKAWPAHIEVFQTQGTSPEGYRIPVLLARYSRPDFDDIDPSIGARLMNISVNLDACQPQLFMKSDPSGDNRIPGVGLMRYDAVYSNGKLSGSLADHRGPQGELTVRK